MLGHPKSRRMLRTSAAELDGEARERFIAAVEIAACYSSSRPGVPCNGCLNSGPSPRLFDFPAGPVGAPGEWPVGAATRTAHHDIV
jgi:hypothetical protein